MKKVLDELHEYYTSGDLVPVIGAGLSMPFEIPSWGKLLEMIVDDALSEDGYKLACKGLINKGQYSQAIKTLKSLCENGLRDEYNIKKHVAKIIKEKRQIRRGNAIDNNYRDIGGMNEFNTILTTNYDEIIYPYLQDFNFPLSLYEYKMLQDIYKEKHLFCLHGFVSNPNSIVLSPDSYDALYSNANYTDIFKFIGSGKYFLFIGNSLTDEYVNALLTTLHDKFKATHYAILPKDEYENNKDKIDKLGVHVCLYGRGSGTNTVFEIRKILHYIKTGKMMTEEELVLTAIDDSVKPTTESFIARSNELELCDNLIKGIYGNQKTLCFFGKKGVGKTRLLQEIQKRIPEIDPAFLAYYGSALRDKTQTLAEFLNEHVNSYKHILVDELYLTDFVRDHNNTVVLIDEFPVDDVNFINSFEEILKTINNEKRDIFFIINCVEINNIQSINNIRFQQLDALAEPDFNLLIDSKKSQGVRPVLDTTIVDFKTIYAFTEGSPQLLNLVLGVDEPKQIINEYQNENFYEKVKIIMKKIDDEISGDDAVKRALDYLSISSTYEVEWNEELVNEIHNIEPIRGTLKAKSLLIKTEKGVKLHDYVSEYFRSKVSLSNKATIHKNLIDNYLKSDHAQKYVLAMRHLFDYSLTSKNSDLLDEDFCYIFDKLFKKNRFKVLQEILKSFLQSLEMCGISWDDTIVSTLKFSYADVLSKIGQIESSIRILEKLRDDSHVDYICGRRFLSCLADCYRLNGKLELGLQTCSDAVKLECSKCKENCKFNSDEIIILKVDYAHALYLVGRFVDSKRELEKIVSEHPVIKNYSEVYSLYCYRYSKTLRALNELESAYNYANMTLRFAGDDLKLKAFSYWSLCTIDMLKENLDDAHANYIKAKKLFEEIGYRASIFVDFDLAEIKKLQGKHDEAIKIYDRIISIVNALGEKNRLAFALLGKAEATRCSKQANNSDAIAKSSLDIYDNASEVFQQMQLTIGNYMCKFGKTLATQSFLNDDNILRELLEYFSSEYPFEEKIVARVIDEQNPICFGLNII